MISPCSITQGTASRRMWKFSCGDFAESVHRVALVRLAKHLSRVGCRWSLRVACLMPSRNSVLRSAWGVSQTPAERRNSFAANVSEASAARGVPMPGRGGCRRARDRCCESAAERRGSRAERGGPDAFPARGSAVLAALNEGSDVVAPRLIEIGGVAKWRLEPAIGSGRETEDGMTIALSGGRAVHIGITEIAHVADIGAVPRVDRDGVKVGAVPTRRLRR